MAFYILVVSLLASAQARPPVDSKKTIKVVYARAEWNKNSRAIDSASVLLRDLASNRLVQIQLDETGPDTAVFTGRFSVNWGVDEQFTPEMYVPPQAEANEGFAKIKSLIESKSLKRKPFLLRSDESGDQVIEVFDTREQVEEALIAHRERERLKQARRTAKFGEGPSELNVEEQRLLQEQILKDKLVQEALARRTERLAIEQKERARLEALAQKPMLAAQLKLQKTQAAKLSEQAMEEYRAGRYQEAEKLFRASLAADPSGENAALFQYGVVLYKLEKYNESIVYLRLAKSTATDPLERKYYLGLNYLKLKETESALATFREIKAAKHPDLSPSAAFYEGVLLFEERHYKQAREPFQECLDTSRDPRLDETAEAYIEQIAKILAWEAERAKRFILTGTLGVQYDSNVLLISDSLPADQRGLPSDTEAERYSTSLGVEWRHFYEKTYELSTKLFASTQISMLGTAEHMNLKKADVSLLSLYVPYRRKGLLFAKGHKLEIAPGFEQAMMALEKDRDTPILHSYVAKISDTMVNNDSWFTVVSVEARKDMSLLESSTGDNDSSANKYTLSTSQIFRLGKDKSKMLNTDLNYSLNQAEGRNTHYNRIDLAFGYRQPVGWDLTWNAGLTLSQLRYDEATTPRTEKNWALTTGATKPLNNWLQVVTNLGYSKNDTDEAAPKAHSYSKYTALVSLVAVHSL